MPLRYLWVFIAYIALRKAIDKFPAEYRFTKNQVLAKFFGWWCFAITAICCGLGMLKGSKFEIINKHCYTYNFSWIRSNYACYC